MNNTTICQHAKSEWGEPILIEGLQQGVNTELTKHNCINSQKCGYCHCCGVESFLDSPFVGNIIYHGCNNNKNGITEKITRARIEALSSLPK